jgi:hypothetical protein
MTDPAPPIAFKTAVCKECGKEFQAAIRYKIRAGKKIAFQECYWCSGLCRHAYRRRVTAR